MREVLINTRKIGVDYPPYIVAELSGNHNHDINKAIKIIESAKMAGVDAVKLQTYTPDTLTIKSDLPDFKINKGPWAGSTLYDLYGSAYTPWEWHQELFDKAKELNIDIFSTPFDYSAVDFLEQFNPPAYKVASFEIVDLPLVKYIAETKKPIIISTGLADFKEISEAVDTVLAAGNSNLILLHCVSSYPAPIQEANLRTITDLADKFNVVSGLSDHTLGTTAAVASIALNASLIEKHVTYRRSDGGPDASFSLEPDELKVLCDSCRSAWSALGEVNYEKKKSEQDNVIFRRSLYVTQDILAGDLFTSSNIRSIRPGYGLPPKHLLDVLNRKAKIDIKLGTALSWDLIE